MTDEALRAGLALQTKIQDAKDIIKELAFSGCELLYCPAPTHYDSAKAFPNDINEAIKPVVIAALNALVGQLTAEFEVL